MRQCNGVPASVRATLPSIPALPSLASWCLLLALCSAAPGRNAIAQSSAEAAPTTLTLRETLRLTLAHNPELSALAWETPQAAGRLHQAGVRPNPTLSADLENFGGSQPGSSGAETTVRLGYLVELGGKRSARVGVARAEQAVMALDIESRRLEIASTAAARFLRLLALESAKQLVGESVRGAEEAKATTSLRVRSGAAHPVEERRAEVELANARLERVLLESQGSLAWTTLAGMWGVPEAPYPQLVGALEPPPTVPELGTFLAALESVPAVSRWEDELERRRRRLALERAQGTPDLEIGAGVRSLSSPAEKSFVGSVSVPLPIFDRNRGATAAAMAAVSQAEAERASARVRARSGVVEAHGAVVRSRRKLDALRQDVIPGASRALADMRTGFERGRFTYIDLLEARRTLIRARREDIDALLELQLALAELRQLTSGSVAAFTDGIGGKP